VTAATPSPTERRLARLLWQRRGVLTRRVHVVVSPFKTGTSSVGQALLDLGVGHREMPHDGALLRRFLPQIRAANRQAATSPDIDSFVRRHGAAQRAALAGLTRALAPYDVFADAPFGHVHLHPFLHRLLAPRACLIWVHRPVEDWLASVRRWELAHPALYPRHGEWLSDPDGRAALKRRNRDRALAAFRRLATAPGEAERCLELPWAALDSYDALAAFYAVPVPAQGFPRRNAARP
jgi:hypothetical protein